MPSGVESDLEPNVSTGTDSGDIATKSLKDLPDAAVRHQGAINVAFVAL